MHGITIIHQGTRVARKLKNTSEWLVTAWAAAGPDREVKVNIPGLGELTLHARACGSVYRVEIVEGKPVMSLTDQDGLCPPPGWHQK